MQNLERRIADLETKSATNDTEPMLIHFVGMNGPEPMKRIVRGGREWLVQPGETDETFRARVVQEDDKPVGKNCVKAYCCY